MADTVLEPVKTWQDAPIEPGDHEKLSHYIRNSEYMDALVSGKSVRALCGKWWVPTRDGKKFPVCPECKEIYDSFGHD